MSCIWLKESGMGAKSSYFTAGRHTDKGTFVTCVFYFTNIEEEKKRQCILELFGEEQKPERSVHAVKIGVKRFVSTVRNRCGGLGLDITVKICCLWIL